MQKAHEALARKRAQKALIQNQERLKVLEERLSEINTTIQKPAETQEQKQEPLPPPTPEIIPIPAAVVEKEQSPKNLMVEQVIENKKQEIPIEAKMSSNEDIEIKPVKKIKSQKKGKKINRKKRRRESTESEPEDNESQSSEEEKRRPKKRIKSSNEILDKEENMLLSGLAAVKNTISNIQVPPIITSTAKSAASNTLMGIFLALAVLMRGYIQNYMQLSTGQALPSNTTINVPNNNVPFQSNSSSNQQLQTKSTMNGTPQRNIYSMTY
jgi:hypothetical protein